MNTDKKTTDVYNVDPLKQYLNQINGIEVLTPEEEKELFIAYKNGDEEARNKIIECNLKLVAVYAKKYAETISGVDCLDMIQEGNIGLIEKGIENFDVDKGYKFSTYATYWIKSKIMRNSKYKGRNIKLPAYVSERISKLYLANQKNILETGRDATAEELSEMTGIDLESIQKISLIRMPTISLELPVTNEEDESLKDYIPDPKLEENGIDTELMSKELKKSLEIIANYCIDEREEEILKQRYGFYDGKLKTYVEISKMFNITVERVRQLEEGALIKMANPIYANELEVYLNQYNHKYSDEKYMYRRNTKAKNKFNKEFESVINYLDSNEEKVFTELEISILKELYDENGNLTKNFKELCTKYEIDPKYCVLLNKKYIKIKNIVLKNENNKGKQRRRVK